MTKIRRYVRQAKSKLLAIDDIINHMYKTRPACDSGTGAQTPGNTGWRTGDPRRHRKTGEQTPGKLTTIFNNKGVGS